MKHIAPRALAMQLQHTPRFSTVRDGQLTYSDCATQPARLAPSALILYQLLSPLPDYLQTSGASGLIS
jgi:hypothetical protein